MTIRFFLSIGVLVKLDLLISWVIYILIGLKLLILRIGLVLIKLELFHLLNCVRLLLRVLRFRIKYCLWFLRVIRILVKLNWFILGIVRFWLKLNWLILRIRFLIKHYRISVVVIISSLIRIFIKRIIWFCEICSFTFWNKDRLISITSLHSRLIVWVIGSQPR